MSFAGFPPGTRFDPDDDAALILEYLLPKVCNPQGFHTGMVLESDLYDEEEKWKAWFDRTGESKLYFFTQLKKKKKEKGGRVERSFGQSLWKSQKDDDIYLVPDEEKTIIGKKRSFSYKVKNGGGASSSRKRSRESENNGWVMHEFRLYEQFAEWLGVSGNSSDGYVICCVRKKEERNINGEIELLDASTVHQQ